MRAIKEGDGTLLDHSMMLFGSSMSDGNKHDPANLPILLAGRARRHDAARPPHRHAKEHAPVQFVCIDAGTDGDAGRIVWRQHGGTKRVGFDLSHVTSACSNTGFSCHRFRSTATCGTQVRPRDRYNPNDLSSNPDEISTGTCPALDIRPVIPDLAVQPHWLLLKRNWDGDKASPQKLR